MSELPLDSEESVSLTMNQVKEMLESIQALTKKVETLQNELEVYKIDGPVEAIDLVSEAERQDVISHTLKRARVARDIARQHSLEKASEAVDLAVEAAIIDYKKNPPAHRR